MHKQYKHIAQHAVRSNSFCMKSDCINYFEDTCSLCYISRIDDIKIYPFNLNSESELVENRCQYYSKGTNVLYL